MIDGLGKQAEERHVSKSLGARFKRGWKGLCSAFVNIPNLIRSNLGITLLLGGCVSIYTWEGWNGTLGFNRIFPSREGFTWIICLASICGYLYFHRKAAETVRNSKTINGILVGLSQGILSIIAACICLFGTFSQVVGDALTVNSETSMALGDRDAIRDQIRAIERSIRNLPRPTNDQALLEDFTDRVNEAKGWGFDNLDNTPGGACVDYKGLSPRMQFLCRDASDIRAEMLENEGQWDAIATAEQTIQDKEAELAAIHDTERARHYEGMERMTGGAISQQDFAVWGLFLLTVAIWFIGGFMFDEAMEARQAAERRAAAQKAKGS
jgi:hypothetical protein